MPPYFALQTAMFEASTAASQQIERQRTFNRAKIRQIEGIPDDLRAVERELRDALNTMGAHAGDLRDVSRWASSDKVLQFSWLLPREPRSLLQRLWPAYSVIEPRVRRIQTDLRAMRQTSEGLVQFLYRPSFMYGGRPVVDSCADYRSFKRNYDSAVVALAETQAGLVEMRDRLGFYGTQDGKRMRNELVVALTIFERDLNRLADYINGIRSTGSLVVTIAAFPRKLWQMIFKPVSREMDRDAGRTGRRRRTKEQFRNYYKDLSLAQQVRVVRRGLAILRDQIRTAATGVGEAKQGLQEQFRGIGKVRAGQPAPNSAAVEGYRGLTAAISTVQGIQAELSSMPAAPNASVIQCQSGSGYAGIFGGEAGEASSPLMVVGGGLIAGVAVAHFFPNLSR